MSRSYDISIVIGGSPGDCAGALAEGDLRVALVELIGLLLLGVHPSKSAAAKER